MPVGERFLYDECSRDADTAVKLAKCVVALMDARDRHSAATYEDFPIRADEPQDDRILARIVKAFWPRKEAPRKKTGSHQFLKNGIVVKPSKLAAYSTQDVGNSRSSSV